MSAALSSRDRVVDQLFQVFRESGFEGATLSKISETTGLGRPSLYHYFPGGKDDMAEAVLGRLEAFLETDILATVHGPGGATVRLRKITDALERVYSGGRQSCVLNVFGIGGAHGRFGERLRTIAESWVGAFAQLAGDAGMAPAAARRRATEALVRVEGALVVARALDDTTVFARTLAEMPKLLLNTERAR